MELHTLLQNEINESARLRAQQDKARCALLELLTRSGGPAWVDAVKMLKPELMLILTDLSR